MEERIVHLEKKFSYGNCHLHPTNEYAKNICCLLGLKTVPKHCFSTIEKLGFIIMIDGNYT